MHPIEILNGEGLGTPVIFSDDQPEHAPITGVIIDQEIGTVLFRWTFTDEEREQVARGADIDMRVLTHHLRLQPITMQVLEVA